MRAISGFVCSFCNVAPSGKVAEMTIRSFRDLDAWQAAMELSCSAYDLAGLLVAVEVGPLESGDGDWGRASK
jgi:hypothetical protein